MGLPVKPVVTAGDAALDTRDVVADTVAGAQRRATGGVGMASAW